MFETSYILTSLVISSIGVGYFIYGKRQKHKIVFYSGIGLMIGPYFFSSVSTVVLFGVALMAAPKIASRLGY